MVEAKKNFKLEIALNDLIFGISLGEGAFGNVRVGWAKSNKSTKYAIKCMKKAEIISSKHVDHIENEKNILEKL
jgi:serine/threonine protein kinase